MATSTSSPFARSVWQKAVQPYQHADNRMAIGQLFNSLLPYLALIGVMYFSLRVSYALTLLIAVPTAGFMVRLFIIFHDCGHNSFFSSKRANRIIGSILGVLVFTPGEHWWHEHALHHATSGNLDQRGRGDVYTMTVEEYKQSSWWKRLGYGVFRHPLILFTIGPTLSFLFGQRFAHKGSGRRELMSVIFTDLAILGIILTATLTVGFKTYVMIQLPIMMIGTSIGVWLFYVQHQFEGVYWARTDQWDFATAAMLGTSYYKLPRVLQWFSGNIGFHNVHHLSPRIPNYLLEQAFHSNSFLQQVKVINLRTALHSLPLRLWDEKNGKLVSFAAVRSL